MNLFKSPKNGENIIVQLIYFDCSYPYETKSQMINYLVPTVKQTRVQ